jgi:hypothetical protein
LGKGAMLQSRANFPEGEVASLDSRSWWSMVPESRAKRRRMLARWCLLLGNLASAKAWVMMVDGAWRLLPGKTR